MMEECCDLPGNRQKLLWYDMEFDISTAKALFNKHFIISKSTENIQSLERPEYALPEPECMFKEELWQNDSLQILKNELNQVKSCLNNFTLDEWQQHTYQMNPAGDVLGCIKKQIQPEFITQAWCKFYEIVCNFSLVPLNKILKESNEENVCSFTSVHLCEAPGAFVVALNHWLKLNARDIQWNWIASTLNPYCEGNPYSQMIDDDRLIRHTLMHWCFGTDNTGNIMDLRNLDALVKRSRTNGGGPIMLITADGSIDCTDMPDEQENAVVHLHFCETVACMHLLEKGGNFVLKMFTLFEHQSVCLMYLLTCAFQEVTATKPATSKAGNSEMYVVCVNFKGKDYIAPYLSVLRCHYDVRPTRAMFSCRTIPDCFMQKIESCCKFFKLHQCKVIRDNINAFHSEMYDNILFKLRRFKHKVSLMYLEKYKLTKIDIEDQIVGRRIIEKNTNYIMTRKLRYDSYNERCRKLDLTSQERIQQIWNKAREIEMPMKNSYICNLRTLPKTLEIQTGKIFHGIYNSRFCEAKILQILNEVNVIQDTHSVVCSPSAEITETYIYPIDRCYDTLSFQFIHVYDSHQIIVEVCSRLEKLRIAQTLVLVNYPLLTQLSVGLLYILGNSFEKIIIEIYANKGYRIILEKYRCDKEVLNYLRTILAASYDALNKNMTIWSIVPMTILYEWDQYSIIMQLNHLAIKLHTFHVLDTLDKT